MTPRVQQLTSSPNTSADLVSLAQTIGTAIATDRAQLSAQGASPRDIDALDDAVAKLRKAPARVWEAARTEAIAESASAR